MNIDLSAVDKQVNLYIGIVFTVRVDVKGLPNLGLRVTKAVVGTVAEFVRKVEAAGGWPVQIAMPCGHCHTISSIAELPTDDLPCPCGNEGHWLFKYYFVGDEE